jgi:hypothetical protein
MRRLIFTFLLIVAFTPGLLAQDKPKEKKETEKKIKLDVSYDYDPQELHRHWRDLIRWKRIKGFVGIGSYHIFPARESGPYKSPPLTIWGQGFGTSLWRDPITGWPIQ